MCDWMEFITPVVDVHNVMNVPAKRVYTAPFSAFGTIRDNATADTRPAIRPVRTDTVIREANSAAVKRSNV